VGACGEPVVVVSSGDDAEDDPFAVAGAALYVCQIHMIPEERSTLKDRMQMRSGSLYSVHYAHD